MKQSSKRGTGCLYRRGKIWWLKYYRDGVQEMVSLGTTVKTEAERARESLLQSLGTVPSAVTKVLTHALESERRMSSRHLLATAWTDRPYTFASRGNTGRELKPGTATINRQGWQNFVRFMAEEHPSVLWMEEVTHKHGEEWLKHIIAAGAGPRSIKIKLDIVKVMYRMADLPDPFAKVQRLRAKTVSRRPLTNDEIGRLVKEASARGVEWRVLFLIGIYTGMRLGDCATLTWDCIDLDAGIISRETAKTGSRVSLPMHPELRKSLSTLPADNSPSPVLSSLCKRYTSSNRRFARALAEIFTAAGIQANVQISGRHRATSVAGFHALRHSFVSACARAGIPEGVVRQWVGHGSLMVTRLYTHWAAADAEGITRAIPSFG